MNAPPFPANPAVGQFFGNWSWNGARWVCSPAAGVRVVTQTFTASGPYMPSPGLVTAVVECIGGGGAGGPAFSPGTGDLLSGGGGGSGGYSRIALAASLVAGGVQVTIGAGGTNVGTPGGGGATTFGALCVANGGGAGIGNDGGPGWGQGGAPAPAGVGDVALPGAGGNNGTFLVFPTATEYSGSGGAMGGSMWGGTVPGPETGVGGNVDGANAYPNTGAGGSSGAVNQAAAGLTAYGGAGGSGICIVTEYCWSDSAADGDCDGTMNVNARVAVEHDQWQRGPGRQGGFEGEDFGDA